MSSQDQHHVMRNEDGTIDIRFYARRAAELRRASRAECLLWIVRAAGAGCAALVHAVSMPRGDYERRSRLAPSDPA